MATEKEEPKMVKYKITVKNPRTRSRFPLVDLEVLVAEDEDQGAFRMALSKSTDVVYYKEVIN